MEVKTRQIIDFYKIEKQNICPMGYSLKDGSVYHRTIQGIMGGKRFKRNTRKHGTVPEKLAIRHRGRDTEGVILSQVAKEYLELIQSKEPELYEFINILLQKQNEQGCFSLQHFRTIQELLKTFEEKYKYKRQPKSIKPLIKRKYKKRSYPLESL